MDRNNARVFAFHKNIHGQHLAFQSGQPSAFLNKRAKPADPIGKVCAVFVGDWFEFHGRAANNCYRPNRQWQLIQALLISIGDPVV